MNVNIGKRRLQSSLVLARTITMAFGMTLLTCSSIAQSDWQQQTTGIDETRYLVDVAYGSGKFIGVGGMTNAIVLVSTNGRSWTKIETSITNILRGVSFVGGKFIAVGELGTIITSQDGLSWTNRNSCVTESLNAVAYGNGLFVAVGDNGSITRSSDGGSWTCGTSITNSYTGIAFGNNVFVAVGSAAESQMSCGEGVVVSSTDGILWTRRTIHTGSIPLDVTFGNGIFVTAGIDFEAEIAGGGCIGGFYTMLTASNGIDWVSITNGPNWRTSIGFGHNVFVSVGSFDIIVFKDAEDWRQTYTASGLFLSGVAFGNGRFVAVGGGKVMLALVDCSLSGATISPSGRLEFWLNGATGELYTIEASNDLLNWEPLLTIAAQDEPLLIEDPQTGLHQRRFYRARLAN